MAKVKIFLDENETLEDAEDTLRKALDLHVSGDIHDGESFSDPAMIDTAVILERLHEDMYKKMIAEILQTLDRDYNKQW
jgi:hypothetical protein